jgi:hypothetical protein
VIAALTVVFMVLVAAEAVGTAAFLALYVRGSDWRATPVGRHLVTYSATLLGLLLLTLVSFLAPGMWLVWPILAGHAAFAAVIWQRVALVWRAQHRQPRKENPRA